MTTPTLSGGRPYRSSRAPGASVYAFLNSGLMGTMTGDFVKARDAYLRALPYNSDSLNAHYLPTIVYSLMHLPNARVQIEPALMVRSQLQQTRPGGLSISTVLDRESAPLTLLELHELIYTDVNYGSV